jgi:hypothetical protein
LHIKQKDRKPHYLNKLILSYKGGMRNSPSPVNGGVPLRNF